MGVIIKFSFTKIIPDGKGGSNNNVLMDCYKWTKGEGSKLGLNYELMARSPSDSPLKKGKGKKGYPKGRKRVYRGKMLKEKEVANE